MPHHFLTLEKTRLRLMRNSFFRASGRDTPKVVILSTLTALFIAGDYWFFRRILTYFATLPMDVGEILVIQLLNLLCLTFFSMLVFSNIVASLSTLYMSRDLDLLISSPIPMRDIFVSRFIQTFINSSWMAALFGLPILIAYGQVYHASWKYYAMLPLAGAPFLLIPSGAGIMATMTLMRFFPARRTHQVLSFVGLVFIGGLVMFFRFLQPEKFIGKDVPEEAIIAFVDKLKAPDFEWLPSAMLSRALQAGALGDWQVFRDNLLWLYVVAVATLLLATALAIKIYYIGWTAGQGSRETFTPKRDRLLYRFLRKALAGLPGDARAIVIKDVKLFWRDTAQWSQLFMLGALVVVYIFNIRNLPLATLYLKNVVSIMNIGLAGIVLAAVAARFVFSTTSIEGRCFWVLHGAPVNFRNFLLAKFFLYLFPLITLAEILVVVSNIFLGVDWFVMAVSAGTIALLTVGLAGLGAGMGAIYPKFDYENIAEVGVTTGAIMYMIISLIYVGACVMLVSRPVYVHLYYTFFRTRTGGVEIYFSYAGLILLTAAFVYFPLKMGIAALKKVET